MWVDLVCDIIGGIVCEPVITVSEHTSTQGEYKCTCNNEHTKKGGWHIHRQTETDRQTDRQTDTHTHTHTHTHSPQNSIIAISLATGTPLLIAPHASLLFFCPGLPSTTTCEILSAVWYTNIPRLLKNEIDSSYRAPPSTVQMIIGLDSGGSGIHWTVALVPSGRSWCSCDWGMCRPVECVCVHAQ